MAKRRYRTRQREVVVEYLRECAGAHITAQSVAQSLHDRGLPTSVATVYRTLDQLEGAGLVRRLPTPSGHAACYEYVGDSGRCTDPTCFHCACRSCGTLIHLHCDELAGLREHIAARHGFLIDPWQTVFYGTCEGCRSKERQG